MNHSTLHFRQVVLVPMLVLVHRPRRLGLDTGRTAAPPSPSSPAPSLARFPRPSSRSTTSHIAPLKVRFGVRLVFAKGRLVQADRAVRPPACSRRIGSMATTHGTYARYPNSSRHRSFCVCMKRVFVKLVISRDVSVLQPDSAQYCHRTFAKVPFWITCEHASLERYAAERCAPLCS